MKVSNETLNILKSFAQINNGIWISEGNVLRTVHKDKNIFAEATIKDSFPTSFGIYDLSNFLGVLSLHKDAPTLEFDEVNVYIKGLSGKSKISYRMTVKEMLTVPPEGKKISLPTTDIVLILEEDDYIWVTNAAKQLQSPSISVVSDGKTHVSLMTWDAKNDAAHSETLQIYGESGCNGVKFEPLDLRFSTDNWNKIIPGSYELKISSKGVSHFKHQKEPLEYFIALEKKAPSNTSEVE